VVVGTKPARKEHHEENERDLPDTQEEGQSHPTSRSTVTAAPSLPRTFGPYALFEFIGKGGMAEIFLARRKTELGGVRLCVVKQILPGLARDPSFSDMLVHEAKLAARLNHGNVVQVFDLGRESERLFIAMEYVEGFDLNDLLRRCSRAKVPFPFELGLHVVREALRGLDYAHRRVDEEGKALGIVHRDVSPSNLLVSFEGEVKVCDFGIARANEAVSPSDAAHELDEALKGKAGYMSPEHARGERIDSRADVFAIGIVLWELAAGRRLYRSGEGRESLLEQARNAQIPELPARGLPDPERLRAIVTRALSPDREQRYPSAASMLRDLEQYAAAARFTTSPLQLGEWLAKTFGEDIVERRRARERAVAALEKGAPVVVEVVPPTPPAAPLPSYGPAVPLLAHHLPPPKASRRSVAWKAAAVALAIAATILAIATMAMR
jgi:serine/threonine-protein kinase